MKKIGITYKILLGIIASFSMLLLSSCSNEKDTTNPNIYGLTFTSYNSKTNECTYTFNADDNTAIKSVYIYKDDSIIYKNETNTRSAIEDYAKVSATCKYTSNGYKIRAIVQDFGGNTTRDTLSSPVLSVVSSPKTGDSWTPNATQTITWTSNFKDNVNIQLYVDTTYREFYQTIASNVSNTGKYAWSVPSTIPSGMHFKIRVSSTVIDAAECFSNRFTIAPYIAVSYPTSGTIFFTGNSMQITWLDNIDYVNVELYKSGKSYSMIAKYVNATNCIWTLPSSLPNGSDYTIRISSTTNSAVYAETPTFTITPLASGSMSDIDGNVYKTITIGTQTWMAENLRTTKYNDGTAIPNVVDATWGSLTTPAYCWYNNDATTYKVTYGALYNWYAVNTGELAPTGWHVPTDAEWTTLGNYLAANGYNYDGSTSGNYFAKSLAANTNWAINTGSGSIGNDLSKNNRTGFSAQPGGSRNINGFYNVGDDGGWWSSTEGITNYAWVRNLYYYGSILYRYDDIKHDGFSVRCVKN